MLIAYDDLAADAHSKGGPSPTEREVRHFLAMPTAENMGLTKVALSATMGGGKDGSRGSNGVCVGEG